MKRLLVDCTQTYFFGGKTGIQRVVRNIAGRWEQAAGTPFECVPVAWVGDRLIEAYLSRGSTGRPPMAWLNRLADALRRIRAFLPIPKGPLAWLWRRGAGWLFHRRYPLVNPGEGDTLLLLDSTWQKEVWKGVARARRDGAKVGFVLYDLIPIRHPQRCEAPLIEVFTRWFDGALENCDFCLTISEAVRRDLEAERLSRRPGSPLASASFQLGAGLDETEEAGVVRPELRAVFDGGRAVCVAVGTIEPRKNHAVILDAFERLWGSGGGPGLCVIGRVGWMCREILDRFERHPQLGRKLSVFHDLSDTELEYAYRRGAALVTASVTEGFGLPVVEGLSYGLPVLASDIPSHREVGGEACAYFDPASPEALAELLRGVESPGPAGRARPSGAPAGWDESFRDLLKKAAALS
jgi:alpha-1,2-rhamnosyltransferase